MNMTWNEVRELASELGPLCTFASVSRHGAPHMVPVIAAWFETSLVFGTKASSAKAQHLRAGSSASIQYLTFGQAFPDALLLHGECQVLQDDHEKLYFWESGSFPALPMIHGNHTNPDLAFVRFTPHTAVMVRNGGRGGVQRWKLEEAK